jgi:methionyl-tRNA formyltransferase
LNPVEQDPTQASYSLWRDEEDFVIDWSSDAHEICRMIDATGYPYAGARTTLGDETIYVEEATTLPDLNFENRTPGKIWSLESGRPIVVCGSGLVRLERCRAADGAEFVFRRLRSRLGAGKHVK